MSAASSKPKSICNFFDDDVVYRIRPQQPRVEMGVVVQSCENADSDVDEELPTTTTKLEPGEAKVAWYPHGNREIVCEHSVRLVCRLTVHN